MKSIVVSEEGFQLFLRFEPVYELEKLKNKVKKEKILYCSSSVKHHSFLNKIEEYVKNNKRNYKNSNYKNRYGIEIMLLLPNGNWNTSRMIKLTSRYVNYIIGKERGLKYLSWYFDKKEARYIRIFICDREVYEREEIEVYKRDYYQDKISKKMCNKKSENAEKIIEKGSYKTDENGNVIKTKKYFKDIKTRIFAYKEEEKVDFYDNLKKLYIQSIKYIKGSIISGIYFRRNNMKYGYDRFKRRIIIAINKCKQYIQNEINIALHYSKRSPDEYEIYKELYEPGELIETSYTKKIYQIYKYFNEIFKNNEFEYEGNKLKISNTNADIVEKNLSVLKVYFNELMIGG